MKSRQNRRRIRRGLTLFELLIALAIFVSSLAALAHLIHAGSRSAIQARLRTQAIIRCESKLSELIAGVEPLQTASNVAFRDNPDWHWSVKIEPSSLPELLVIETTVSHTGNSALANTSFSLRRYTRDPRLFQSRAVRTVVQDRPPTIRNTPEPDSGSDLDQ